MVVLMLSLAEKLNSRKKLNNLGTKELVKTYGNVELEWVENAQGGRNGPRKPISNRMGRKSPK